MVALKAQEIERWLSKPDPDRRVILLYGPDEGLVGERADRLIRSTGADGTDPMSVLRLTADEAAADPLRVADEAHAVSMFGGERIIRITGTTQKNVTRAIEPLLATPPEAAWVIMEAGELRKGAGLRTAVERSANAVAVPCYGDGDRDLDQLIDEECTVHGLAITPEARRSLKASLGADRRASRAEVAKLCLYAMRDGTIETDHIDAIVGDAAAQDFDRLVDMVLLGHLGEVERDLPRMLGAGTTTQTLAILLQRHLLSLLRVALTMVEKRTGAASAVGAMRPPPHFRRRDRIVEVLNRWPADRLERAAARVARTILQMRRQGDLEIELLSTTMVAIAVEASSLARRRG